MKTKNVEVDTETNSLIEANRKDFSETQNDIIKRCLKSIARGSSAMEFAEHARVIGTTTGSKLARSSQLFTYYLFGARNVEPSMRAAYISCLRSLQAKDSNFYLKLSQEETRARRIVSETPEKLYKNSPELADQFAERIDGSWYVDVNLSEPQVVQRLKIACKVAGIEFGRDLVLDQTH